MPTVKSSDLVPQRIDHRRCVGSRPTIEADGADPLAVGASTFQLVVQDDSGNVSTPAAVRVIVVDDQAPTAEIDAPRQVGIGRDFSLSGARSIDVGGALTTFVWTLIDRP